ncbi:Asp23/Gls24 family envelope stress response protein [Thermoactinomyces mirandus]|uniref:Asp23/Gls24 family envelope stress response protein n=1 Tax=Thermoactinomyces mirandus TaxID=2756294 RepID=A0A7W2APY0_9BACL|nr:Asp23/Gls24 family envelope stress response protein [Thermoactinomyces mirandus]MBA4600908.1 Asp23/Gls24 family envelope stress response protein [Thermoactinomyces mirandus]
MSEAYEHENNSIGKIEIAPEVIQIISGIAADSVEGVIGLSGGATANINQLLGRKNLRKGIHVDLGDQLSVQLAIVVQYGYNIPDVGRKVQEEVKAAIENMTGLFVDNVSVRVDGIKMPSADNRENETGSPRVQ